MVEILTILRAVREETLPLMPDLAIRATRWSDALDLEEAAAMVREGRGDELASRLRQRLLVEVPA